MRPQSTREPPFWDSPGSNRNISIAVPGRSQHAPRGRCGWAIGRSRHGPVGGSGPGFCGPSISCCAATGPRATLRWPGCRRSSAPFRSPLHSPSGSPQAAHPGSWAASPATRSCCDVLGDGPPARCARGFGMRSGPAGTRGFDSRKILPILSRSTRVPPPSSPRCPDDRLRRPASARPRGPARAGRDGGARPGRDLPRLPAAAPPPHRGGGAPGGGAGAGGHRQRAHVPLGAPLGAPPRGQGPPHLLPGGAGPGHARSRSRRGCRLRPADLHRDRSTPPPPSWRSPPPGSTAGTARPTSTTTWSARRTAPRPAPTPGSPRSPSEFVDDLSAAIAGGTVKVVFVVLDAEEAAAAAWP